MALKIALACGGTGGHVFPALAVGRILSQEYGFETVLFGRRDSLEQRLAERDGVPFVAIPAVPFQRSGKWRNLAVPVHLLRSLGTARKLLRREGVSCVFATSGYVSLPTGLAASLAGLPLWLLEPNAHAGLANRLLGNRARRVFAGSPAAGAGFPAERTEVTGNPVRPLDGRTRQELRAALGLSEEERFLLVLGGSQGARGVNEMLSKEARALHEGGWTILWQTGEREFELRRSLARGIAGVQVESFLHDVYAALGAADLCVSRSGAGAVAELALHGLPTVLVPYPHATDNHQETNARELEEAGAGVVLTERAYGDGLLKRSVDALWSNRQKAARALLAFSRPDAASHIASRIAGDLGARP